MQAGVHDITTQFDAISGTFEVKRHACHVTFFMHPEERPFESKKQGRPIFEEVEYCRILYPGGKERHEGPVTDQIKRDFRSQYHAWKSDPTRGERHSGTPIEHWPQLTATQRAVLLALNIITIEQLAEASDAVLSKIGLDARPLQEMAKAYLAAAQDASVPQSQAVKISALEEENTSLRSEVDELRKMIIEMKNEKRGKKE